MTANTELLGDQLEEAQAIINFAKKTLADAGFQHLPEALKELKTQADRVRELEAQVEAFQTEAIEHQVDIVAYQHDIDMAEFQIKELEAEVERQQAYIDANCVHESEVIDELRAKMVACQNAVRAILDIPAKEDSDAQV